MATLARGELSEQERRSHEMGMHTEKLGGRSKLAFFDIDLNEAHHGFSLPNAFDVDFNKRAEIDAAELTPNAVNLRIRQLMQDGYGTIVIKNPGAKHSIAVGILNRLNLIIEGSLGYFGLGLIDGPNVRISGRVGWSCAENMMSGTILIEKNAGSQFGAAIRGGDLVCRGDVGSRTGIDMKGGTIIVGGNTGAEPASLGVDAVWAAITDLDRKWLERKLRQYDLLPKSGIGHFRKIVAGKQLWNYDNLKPTEKKLVQ